LTHLMIEANYDSDLMDAEHMEKNLRVMRTHMSIDALEEWLRRYDGARTLEQIWLLHLSDGNSNAEEFKRRIQARTGSEVYVA
ncbi:MAG: hypothetical protein NC311_15360, partial [Muribaculaceae bacterium]|nr:hypothetical protein [Muribaculaceae bacterium]